MTEQLRIPSAWLVFIVLHIIEVIRSIVEHLGDDEGDFLGQSKLVRPFLVHSEHKVAFLKCSASGISGMESTQGLLIDG